MVANVVEVFTIDIAFVTQPMVEITVKPLLTLAHWVSVKMVSIALI